MKEKQKTLVEQVAEIIRDEQETGDKWVWAETAAVRIIELVRAVVRRDVGNARKAG